MSDVGTPNADLDDEVVREMVAACQPDWTVESIEHVDEGTDFVAVLELDASVLERADRTATAPPERAVLKATTAGFVDPEVARSEPRLFELLGTETTVPVPDVYGYCDDHGSLPAPFFLLEYVPGENHEDSADELSEHTVRRVLREAGENLAELHELGPLLAVGRVGVRDGDVAVLDSETHPRYDDARDRIADEFDDVLEALADGTWFPERADDPDRFVDLVPALREYAAETVPALSEPEPATYCHWDYRWGNVLVDPDTGETTAVLDWANLAAMEPAYNLAKTESHMLDAGDPDPETLAERKRCFRDAYVDGREHWSFTPAVEERIECYRLLSELQAMACLPLWHEDATASERDAVASDHRALVHEYV